MKKIPLQTLGPFKQGLDRVNHEDKINSASLDEATNVDIDRFGNISRREGYSRLVSTTAGHSLWSTTQAAFYVDNGTLYRRTPQGETYTVASGLGSAPLSYELVGDWIYYTNGDVSNRIHNITYVHRSGWTCPTNPPPGGVAQTTGTLQEGTYHIAVAGVNDLGEESGCAARTLTLDGVGGIALTGIDTSGWTTMRVYVSPPNGTSDELYLQYEVPVATSFTVTHANAAGRACQTLNMTDMPSGSIVRYYRGRLYVVEGQVLWISGALHYGLTALDESFLYYPEAITTVAPTESGLFISADRLYFIAGSAPQEFQQTTLDLDPIIPGTAIQVPAEVFRGQRLKQTTPVVYWVDAKGPKLGLADGSVLSLKANEALTSSYSSGASLIAQRDGKSQVLTSLANKQYDAGFAATDYAVAEVRRNGIIV